VDGKVKVGVLACPNLPTTFNDPSSPRGVLIYGVTGDKAYHAPISNPEDTKVCTMKPVKDLSQATFCESVERAHSSHGQQSQIARILGIKTESVRMDSQAKYATLTQGDADIYLRLPVSMSYEEKIWVHTIFLGGTDHRIMLLDNYW
jgi:3'(2'), 5'-bisphosphate nucleotidase